MGRRGCGVSSSIAACTAPRTSGRSTPLDLVAAEGLRPLPAGWVWERVVAEDRRVSWDGDVSYDGVLYGLPSRPRCTSARGRAR
jgi:hypothetical protein